MLLPLTTGASSIWLYLPTIHKCFSGNTYIHKEAITCKDWARIPPAFALRPLAYSVLKGTLLWTVKHLYIIRNYIISINKYFCVWIIMQSILRKEQFHEESGNKNYILTLLWQTLLITDDWLMVIESWQATQNSVDDYHSSYRRMTQYNWLTLWATVSFFLELFNHTFSSENTQNKVHHFHPCDTFSSSDYTASNDWMNNKLERM
jgi:hypothetical protein